MATKADLQNQISSLWGEIKQYKADIQELSDARDYISDKHQKVTGVYDKMTPYDVTRDAQWLGDLNDTMDGKRNQTSGHMSRFMGKTAKFLSDIDIAISKLWEKISSCMEAINGLQAQIDAMGDEE